MDQQGQFFKKRLADLSRRAEDRNIVTFSNFLNMDELNIFHQITKELPSSFQTYGGYSYAERQMVAFIPDALSYSWEYPMDAVIISPLHPKFAEKLSHRDVLGALMNLGIKREMIGDILVQDTSITVFCVNAVTGFVIENCSIIRHTPVSCRQAEISDINYEPTFIEKEGIVSSLRLDTILADICKLPRNAAQKLISEGNACINARKIEQNGYNCQTGDVLSVRHYGKFLIGPVGGTTKKGRMKYTYKIYS